MTAAAAAWPTSGGVARRFERKGTAAGVTVVDDYAHLPTEVRRRSAASGGYERVVAVFQPHRLAPRRCGRSSAPALGDADLLVLTDIYPAGRSRGPG